MNYEHVVVALSKSSGEPRDIATFEPRHWQWALKLADYLRERGALGVEVITRPVGEEDEACEPTS